MSCLGANVAQARAPDRRTLCRKGARNRAEPGLRKRQGAAGATLRSGLCILDRPEQVMSTPTSLESSRASHLTPLTIVGYR